MNTPALEELRAFHHQVYIRFGCRRDALFELLDALLAAPTNETPAHPSLVPICQRGWGSLYDALKAGTKDWEPLERLIASYPVSTETAWYAVNASVWPRCDAETSPAHGYYVHPYRHPMVSRLWLDGTIRGPCRCPAAAPVGRLRCACAGCCLARTSMQWPLNRSAPGSARRPRGARRPAAHLQLRRGL